jgi:hypothetical protein
MCFHFEFCRLFCAFYIYGGTCFLIPAKNGHFFFFFPVPFRSFPSGEAPLMVEETESKRETSVLLRAIEELHAGEDGLENLGKLVGSVISAPRVNLSRLSFSHVF